jgi:hypothetical protein
MASLAQYSAALSDAGPRPRRTPGHASRWFGYGVYALATMLVVVAAAQPIG